MLQEEASSDNLISSKLRPKLENCEVVADHMTASWNKVPKVIVTKLL